MEKIECPHCTSDKGMCLCDACQKMRGVEHGWVICTVCNGTKWVFPTQQNNLSLSIVGVDDIDTLREYSEILKGVAEMQKDLLIMQLVQQKIKDE